MKPFAWVGTSILIIVILIAAVAFIRRKDAVPEKHVEVVLRDIGHQLLLSANDSSSRVLPVKKVNATTYQISFQKEFRFISDSLINIVQRTLRKNSLANNYIVSLKKCDLTETLFAFEINSQTGDLTPCRGRTLDIDCYVIEIELMRETRFNFLWLLLVLFPLSMGGFYLINKLHKKEEKEWIADNSDFIKLGSFRFYRDRNMLISGTKSITLTDKETRALTIFAANTNQIIARETLMKELWEDEGVVVISRNVDVLVSKLRKKFSDDNSIKFINVPGRGYRFIIE